jgi:hypothetical protein
MSAEVEQLRQSQHKRTHVFLRRTQRDHIRADRRRWNRQGWQHERIALRQRGVDFPAQHRPVLLRPRVVFLRHVPARFQSGTNAFGISFAMTLEGFQVNRIRFWQDDPRVREGNIRRVQNGQVNDGGAGRLQSRQRFIETLPNIDVEFLQKIAAESSQTNF